jgi:hypothetical protein
MMRKLLITLLVSSLWTACSDGDLQVETIDFSTISIQICNDNTELLFKTSADEAIILELPNNLILNEPTSGEPRTSQIPGSSKFLYRFFSENVSNSYFCSALPPATPVVNDELEATAGTVLVNTVEIIENEITRYEHTINIEDLVLLNTNGERIIDTNFEFGVLSTTAN